MKNIGLGLLILLSIGLCGCATQPGDEQLSSAELATAGNASMPQSQSVKTLYNHAAFVAPTKKEPADANS